MGLQLITGPTVEPVSLEEAKKQVELPDGDPTHESHLEALITSARRDVERYTRRALVNQTWKLTRNTICGGRIYLPRPPLVSVTSAQYRNSAGTFVSMVAGTDYTVCNADSPGFIWSENWPSLDQNPDGLRITYVAGFGADAESVPQEYRTLILELVAFRFRYRGDFMARIPDHLMWSMKSLRLGVFGDYYEIKQ